MLIKLIALLVCQVGIASPQGMTETETICKKCYEDFNFDVCKQYGTENFKTSGISEECYYNGYEYADNESDVLEGDMKRTSNPARKNCGRRRSSSVRWQDAVQSTDAVGDSQSAFGRHKLWPNGVVPYKFEDEFPKGLEDNVESAIDLIERKTCLKFVHRSRRNRRRYPNFVVFKMQNKGCAWGHVGMQMEKQFKNRGQEIMLSKHCSRISNVLHEIMHALGFLHEHSRPDRNKYVRILWNNTSPNKQMNFKKYDYKLYPRLLKYDYDYHSITHYPPFAFRKYLLSHTIEPIDENGKKTNVTIGLRETLSAMDIEKINDIYQCPVEDHATTKTQSSSTANPATIFS